MKLSRACIYALHGVAHMAEHGDFRLLAARDVAAARGIPRMFLTKALKPLVSARVLLCIKGPTGGFRLRRPADQITLLEIVEAMDGPIRGNVAFADDNDDVKLGSKLRAVCDQAAEVTRKKLGSVSVAQLVGMGGKKK